MKAKVQTRPAWEGQVTAPVQLVLEGGSMRNPFTCGVLDFFMDQGLFCESVIGASVGAMCGYNYVAGAPGRMVRFDLQYRHDWRFMSLKSRIKTGNLIGLKFLCDTIPNEIEHLDHTWFTESPMKLTAVSTNLETGEPDYHVFEGDYSKKDFKYMFATASLPYVNQPVVVDGKVLMDGGVSDRIPWKRGQERYRGRQIVVLTRSPEFVQKRTYDTIFAQLFYKGYPRFIARLEERGERYPQIIADILSAHRLGDLFVIRPEHELHIGTTERSTKKMFAAYEAGLARACKVWDELKEFLGDVFPDNQNEASSSSVKGAARSA